MAKILIALGGNALELSGNPTIEAQKKAIAMAMKEVVNLVEDGHQVIITHGNGPQVGRILLQNELAKDQAPPQPLDMCGAMTQGSIGYMIEGALRAEFSKKNIEKDIATIITQVVVDKNDPAFNNPTKPIGSFVSEGEAKEIMATKGHVYKEDSGRGWRRVVASPVPKALLSLEPIKLLFGADVLTIVCGGGGIPVIKKGTDFIGIEAVIDKDLSASLLASLLSVDYLVILTAVEKVAINFNTPDQQDLNTLTVAQAEEYAKQGHFAEGSMLPKVKAAINFIKTSKSSDAKAVITSLKSAKYALSGKNGTTITH